MTLHYGKQAASTFCDYHVQHGGISRYKKFVYFLEKIIQKPLQKDELDKLLDRYAKEIRNGLLTCEIAKGLDTLREKTRDSKWFIVSGGDQLELREVFATRGLHHYFDGGIFGSPDTKEQILEREIQDSHIQPQAVFIGDSQYDYQAAKAVDMDFIFVSDWSESDYGFEDADYIIKNISLL